MLPTRLIELLQEGASSPTARFPLTEIFNEGWMLRLILDATQHLGVTDSPLRFLPDAGWFSEARLGSPFQARYRGDDLAEGFTNVDGVIGHFDFRSDTKAGLRISANCRQLVVVEAKISSNLSSRVSNATGYDQAARNVACIADAIARSGVDLADIDEVGFYVVAPLSEFRPTITNLEKCTSTTSIQQKIDNRICDYESAGRTEAESLRVWEHEHFMPLLDRMESANSLRVLSWDELIKNVSHIDSTQGDEILKFYQRCLKLASPSKPKT